MSNHLAIAAVTATLVQLLEDAVNVDFPGAHAVAGRPDEPAGNDAAPEIRVFLYRVEPNAAWRNLDLPTRNGEGAMVDVPQAALDLHYLLTFIGNEGDYEPQRLLGSAARALHVHPLLTRDEIGRMVQAQGAAVPPGPLLNADLDQQPDLVRFVPDSLSLDELSNLWSSFFQAEYRLSTAYRASVVLLTPSVAPVRALPVRERRLYLAAILRPHVARVRAAAGEDQTILPGTLVRVEGSQLRGEEETLVRVGDEAVAIPAASASPTRLEFTLPVAVRAGATGLRVEHRREMGDPPEMRPAGHSNVQPIVVHPVIRPSGAGHAVAVAGVQANADGTRRGTLTLTVDPAVGARQQVAVLLNGLGGGGAALSFFDERRDAPGDPETANTLTLGFDGVPPGDYLVRVMVDGAESPLAVESAPGPNQGAYTAPRVTVP